MAMPQVRATGQSFATKCMLSYENEDDLTARYFQEDKKCVHKWIAECKKMRVS